MTEAEARVNRLKDKLQARGTHPDVIAYCSLLLHQQNYFHAVLEATKSVAEKIRVRSGETDDGAILVDKVFSGTNPILRINAFVTESASIDSV
ncbi:MAG TPA: TIGR02391 family protein [Chlorobiota bacterium]|nr:TIGR02391 family protein [Chlorobiota bacterium]